MSSELKANKISPATSTDITLGDSGDTFTVPSGATLAVSGTMTLPANSVDSDQYVDGSIDNAHLADDAVDSDELAAGAVDIAHMSATGTASGSTFLRGDNAWASASTDLTAIADGSAGSPSIANSGDTDTGIYFPAADTVGVVTGGTERIRVDANGGLVIGDTTNNGVSNYTDLSIGSTSASSAGISILTSTSGDGSIQFTDTNGTAVASVTYNHSNEEMRFYSGAANHWTLGTTSEPRKLFSSSPANNTRKLYVSSGEGSTLSGIFMGSAANGRVMDMKVDYSDRSWIYFYQGASLAGHIQASSGNVVYNTFTGAHWSTTDDESMPEIEIGTVCSAVSKPSKFTKVYFTTTEGDDTSIYYDPNDPPVGAGFTDAANDIDLPSGKTPGDVFTQDGIEYTVACDENDKLPQFKISDVENDSAVYGIFHGWSHVRGDNTTSLHSLGVSRLRCTGPCVVGDLLVSAGDGTAKVQADDIIRSSTIGKVTIGKPDAPAAAENIVAVVLYCG